MNDTPSHPENSEESVRHHVFDGIQEYNKRLPNWWLLTFYGAIVFSIGYWFYYTHTGIPVADGAAIDKEMQRIEAIRMAASADLTDEALWKMSQNPVFVAAGKETFNQNCAACHLTSLRGKEESPAAIGPNLIDTNWLYGTGKPLEVHNTVTHGTKNGMPAWGPVLGDKKVVEVVAYVLSHHSADEAGVNVGTAAQ